MSASRNALGWVLRAALLVSGCDGLWNPFLADRGLGPDANPDGGSTIVIPENITGLCPTASLCWQNPLPQGNRLASVRAIASNDVWAVGAAGTILHWDGTRWSLVPSGTTNHLNDLWAYNAQTMWVVGHGSTILRYTPPGFAADAVAGLGDLYAVRGIDPQKVWAAGSNNAAAKWNGMQWLQPGAGIAITYRGIWPEDVNQAWACTMGGSIWSWQLQPDLQEASGFNTDLLRLWGTSRSNLFALGGQGILLTRGTTGTWTPIASNTLSTLGGMWGPDSSEAWIVGTGGTIA
jgi:hypothetical protein